MLTVFLSGFMLTLIGLLRLGSLIRYIPHAVTVGFTCGIEVTILARQIKDLGGLKLPAAESGQLLPKLAMLGQALPTISPASFAIGAGSVALIFLLRRLLPNWPGMLIAVVLASLAAGLFRLPVDTIGNHFGQIPDGWPVPRWQHRYNMEVVAQVIANVASAIFGGISVTGTIARTATNIRAGACSPVSAIAHALFVLLFMLVAAPLASFIPLSALAVYWWWYAGAWRRRNFFACFRNGAVRAC